MSRLLLPACIFGFVLSVLPAQTYAQQNNNTDYGSYVQDFYGTPDEKEEEEKPKGPSWQYDKKFKKNFDQKKGINPLPMGTQQMYFVRKEGMKDNEAVLRMVTPVMIEGCANIVPPVISMRRGGNILIFKIEDAAIALKKKTQYAQFQCENGAHLAFADITLNRDELMRDNIKAVSFQAAHGAMDIYNVNVSPEKIALVPRTAVAFIPLDSVSKTDPLVFNFYPDNIVMLYAPSAPKGKNLSAEITALAQKKGLMESAALKNGPGLYFIDQAGTLASTLEFGANAYVGTVTAQETYQGPNGPYEQEKPVDVYAKRPGLLD